MYRNILMLETRRKIYNSVLDYPGLHVREIERKANIPFSTVKYHLNFLQKRELIKEQASGRYTRYYITEKIGRNEKIILGLLRQETTRGVILYLLTHVYGSQIDMSNGLEKHPTTIEFHLKKLLENEVVEVAEPKNGKLRRDISPQIIECEPVGKEVIYILKDPFAIYDLLIAYEQSLVDDKIGRVVLDFVDDIIAGGIPDKVNNPKDMIDIVFDAFFEIFPHPYHV